MTFFFAFCLGERNSARTLARRLPRQLFLCSPFYGKDVGDSSHGEDDFLVGKTTPKEGSASFCNESSGEDGNISANERNGERF